MAKQLRPLTGLDALFLYLEATGTPMHVASLMRVAPPARGRRGFAAVLREHLIARLARLALVRRVLQDVPFALGHPVWRELESVDLGAHISIRRLRRPGSDAQLNALVAKLHASALPRDKPLWQIVIIEGLADGSLGLYMKSHHALVDGQAGVQVAQAIFDIAPLAPERPDDPGRPTSSPPPPRDALARTALRQAARQFAGVLRGVPESWRRLRAQGHGGGLLGRLRDSVFLAPRTPFNVQLGAARRVAFCSLPLDQVKRIGKHFGASLNDVVMALVADALRDYLRRRRQLPKRPLIAAMPVSLRQPGQEGGNEVSMVQCPLATDLDDPVERLRAIAAATGQIKGRVAAFKDLIPTDFPGIAAPLWATGLSRLWRRGRLSERLPPLANLAVSNVPGPPVPLYVAGARVRHYYPVSIVTHGLGLNITLVSYAGSLEFGIVSARESLERPHQICERLQAALERFLQQVDA